MSTSQQEADIQVIERFVQAENERDMDAMDLLFADDVKIWANGTRFQSSWADYRPIVAATMAAFPDSHRERLLTVADEAVVAFRWHVTGTHLGVWSGIPPSGNTIEFNGTSWVRIEDGRIAEGWFDMVLASPLAQIAARD